MSHNGKLRSCVLIVSTLMALPAMGQSLNSEKTRFTIGAAFTNSQPKEEFRYNVGNGFGGGGSLLYRLDRTGWIGLRFDASGVQYGKERKRVPFSESVGSRILVDVTTTNKIAGVGFGPEVGLPHGAVRPYVSAAYSALFFRTTSSVKGVRSSEEEIASTTNHKDTTGSWVYSGGIRMPLKKGDSPITLDVGIRYYRGGRATYLNEGGIVDNPDGSITITPFYTQTPFIVYSFGVRFQIPYRSKAPCPRFLC